MRSRILAAAVVAVAGVFLAGCGAESNTHGTAALPRAATSWTFLAPPSLTPVSPISPATTEPRVTEEPIPEAAPPPPPEPTEAPSPENPALPQNDVLEQWEPAPGQVIPGGQILNINNGFACSAGWLTGAGDRRFIITAGHCGVPGQLFAAPDGHGNYPVIGTMVDSWVNGSPAGIFGVDIGLIELYPTTIATAALPLDVQVSGWQSLGWLEATRPEICRLGYRTGLSCGPYYTYGNEGQFYYQGFSNTGDSGGPIFARHGGQLWAVGVASAYDFDMPALVGMSIGDWMPGWDLTLYTAG